MRSGKIWIACLLAFLAIAVSRFWMGARDNRIPPFVRDESRRVVHSDGYSIIVPPGWECSHNDERGLFLHPLSPNARRLPAFMTLWRLTEPPDTTGFVETRLGNDRAWERMEVVRADTFDDPARSVYTLYVTTGDAWWEFKYTIAAARTTLPESVLSYRDTIRLEASSRVP